MSSLRQSFSVISLREGDYARIHHADLLFLPLVEPNNRIPWTVRNR